MSDGNVSDSAIDATLWFRRKYDDVLPPKDLTGELIVVDRKPDEFPGKVACRVAFTVPQGTITNDKKLKLHLAAKCPPPDKILSRYVEAWVTLAGEKSPPTFKQSTLAAAGHDPNAKPYVPVGSEPTKPISSADKAAHFKKALAAIGPTTQTDSMCTDDKYSGLPRRERVRVSTVSYEEALKAFGLSGGRASTCPGVLYEPKLTVESAKRLVYVFRADTCVLPVADAATKTFTPGHANGAISVVDLLDGSIVCRVRASAESSEKVRVYKGGNVGSETAVDLREQLHDATKKALRASSVLWIERVADGNDPSVAPDYY